MNHHTTRTILCLLLAIAAGQAWGKTDITALSQTTGTASEQTDYSGVYYIGTVGYDASTPASNFYLCPTENWCYYQATDDFTGTDNGNPFLTTYKCRGDAYDATKAVWIVEKHPDLDYYYIKQALTGKYLVSNGTIRTTGNADRMRVHLEAITPESLDDKELFSIDTYSTYLVISPKGVVGGADIRRWLTVNGGNVNSLQGASGKTNGPTGYTNTKGIIGIYTIDDNNAKFYLEPATIEPPVITPGDDGTVTITAETGARIYYTLDGTTPTTATTTSGTTSVTVGLSEHTEVVKAIAKGASDYFATTVTSYALPQCRKPVITVADGMVTITCDTPGATIRYTTSGTEATLSSPNVYNGPFSMGDAEIIRAIASKVGYAKSEEAYYMDFKTVSSSDDITNMQGAYRLASDFTSSAAIGSASEPFKGTIDGQYNTISLQGHPLVACADGATIKNVVVGSVSIAGEGNVGALCNEATGATRIYNCGVLAGSVSGSDNVGGLVGLIRSGSSVRVVNCYSYATVSGGSTMAGIVGNNQGTVGNVRIALCMMYGDMPGGTSPVYAGNHTSNVQNYTEYNYWRSRANLAYTAYNDQLAIDKDDDLTRFPFYRHILNTHRELAAFFLFGTTDGSVADITATEVAEIGHWVLKRDVALYPIIEAWQTHTRRTTVDIAANLPNTTAKGAGKLLKDIGDDGYYTGTGTKVTAMGTAGYLTVNLSINGTSFSARLPITDMDEANYDYTWGKVVLPFANEFSGWTRDYSKVCTGWEITDIVGGTEGSFAHYNIGDRDCTAKDLYANSDYIFAQGGNYIVPYGVTAISITAHFANAFYLSDPSYEVGYNTNFEGATALGGSVPTTYHRQPVFTSLSELVESLSKTANPHDQAIVLVGNFHYNIKTLGGSVLDQEKAVTIMSTDEDCNQEPDYGWYTCNTTGRLEVPPLRFDFVPNIEMGMSSRVGSSLYPGIGIWHARGWFELTETCVSKMTQCEINDNNFTDLEDGRGNNRWIANSGYFTQIVRARDGNCEKLSYIQIGGNAYVKELYPGSHTDNGYTCTAVPIAVTGGQVDECFMTGYTAKGGNNKTQGKLTGSMIYFWGTGGKIGKFLGSYLENPETAGITAKVDHALIGRFFGGGTSAAARIKGNIDVTINNSMVDFYCGGPEFGKMESGKTVTTHAVGTTFGEYYGAGFGGTSITYKREAQTNNLAIGSSPTTTYDLSFSTYYKRLTEDTSYGIGSCYKFEYIFHSDGKQGVTRFYTGYAQFDLATTGNVTNTLSHCNIKKLPGNHSLTPKASTGDFYGAGCQGKVDGSVSSTLTDCTVEGSAYGGGFKAESNEVQVYTTNPPAYSVYTRETGIFSDFGTFPAPETYTWKAGTAGADKDKHELYTGMTQAQMEELGNVTGAITLTIDGQSTIGTTGSDTGGCVFGGGNESVAKSDATVTLKGYTHVLGNVYGGGNKADVEGNSMLSFPVSEAAQGVVVDGNAFGGGKGLDSDADAAKVHKNSTVEMSAGHVIGHVYGGGEMASVGDKDEVKGTVSDDHPFGYTTGTARVTINGSAEVGTAENCLGEQATGGYVYGSGLGKAGSTFSERTFVKNTIVTVGGNAHVRGSVFGSGENGHVRHDTEVLIQDNCKIGTELTTYTITQKNDQGQDVEVTINEHDVDADGQGVVVYRGNVYGGGRGVDHTAGDETHYSLSAGRVYGNTDVRITGGYIYHDVFGGGSLATVGTATYDDQQNITAYTDGTGMAKVTISGGVVGYSRYNDTNRGRNCGFVYGGCRGLAGVLTDDAVHMAYVHNTQVYIREGARIMGSVFGGGANGHVAKDTYVEVSGGDIGEPLTDAEAAFDAHGLANITVFRGNVYAGGRGVDHNNSGNLSLTAGMVYGNAELKMTGGHVWHNIYGAGSMASVGTVTKDAQGNLDFQNGTWDTSTGHVKISISGGIVGDNTLAGGTIAEGVVAVNDHPGRNNGRVYGAGRGVSAGRSSYMSGMQYVYDTEVNISGDAYIFGAVFGGGENGHVKTDTHVNISGGIIGYPLTPSDCVVADDGTSVNPWRGHVFGGGRGVDPVFHEYTNGHSFTAGRVYGNTNVTMTGGLVRRAIYGGGLLASVGNFSMEDANSPTVSIDEDDILAWDFDEKTNRNGIATITISGGYIGNLNSDGTLIEGGGRPGYNNGHVYGSGCGMVADALQHDQQYSQMGYVYRSVVTVSQPDAEKPTVIRGSVFGSGENGHVWEDTYVTVNGGTIGAATEGETRFAGNVYGSGRGVDHTAEGALTHISRSAGKVQGNTHITLNGGTVWNDVYGGGSMASIGDADEVKGEVTPAYPFGYRTGTANVTVQGTASVHGSVYGSGRGIASTSPDYTQAAFIKNSDVRILGNAHIYHNVYGGGNAGHVRKDTKVTVGTASGSQQPTIDGHVYGGGNGSTVSTTAGLVAHNVEVNILGGTIKKNVYGGGAIAFTNIHDADSPYASQCSETTKEQCTTIVNLMGGTIEGDAYGGGEGVWDNANGTASVFGDVFITLGGQYDHATQTATATATATAFKLSTQKDDSGNDIAASGRVFGCNNLNGSPKGSVLVRVEKTVAGNVSRTADVTSHDAPHTYEVAAVYGGGNLSPYQPLYSYTQQHVSIETCDVSIREVYGGGNAASVPVTDVLVKGAYEIETVFGGGNGKDRYTVDKGASWVENPGADVAGNTGTLIQGGYIHEAYGGSNERGQIGGSVTLDAIAGNSDCPLVIDKLVCAGKNADVEGDVRLVLGCKPEGRIAELYGGADNANVNGSIDLTITSGNFGRVFGGNNVGGVIRGHIVLNIEETNCTPITIDELYGCGNQAMYSVYHDDDRNPLTLEQFQQRYTTDEAQSAHRYADPVLNVISATRIGQVFGGGYGARAVVYGSPTVNVNQIPGAHARRIDLDGDGATDNNPQALGAIGSVYGGGNAADVYGNTLVNVATAETVLLTSVADDPATPAVNESVATVKGANITGNVYGGGNNAKVTGNAQVVIGRRVE